MVTRVTAGIIQGDSQNAESLATRSEIGRIAM
jgi:hypothetical protein